MLTARPSTEADVASMVPRLRQEDIAEVLASGSPSVELSLLDGLRSPDGCFSAVDGDDLPIFMFGTVPHPCSPLVGLIWLLASEDIHKHRTAFLRNSRPYLESFHAKYPLLMNHTDCRNTLHHSWLRWCGFSFINTVEGEGPGGHPFYEVVRLRT